MFTGPDRRPRPDDFELRFVELGRHGCIAFYQTNPTAVSRWIEESGKEEIIDRRSRFVRCRRWLMSRGRRYRKTFRRNVVVPYSLARSADEFLRRQAMKVDDFGSADVVALAVAYGMDPLPFLSEGHPLRYLWGRP